jgi:hypothetical protein
MKLNRFFLLPVILLLQGCDILSGLSVSDVWTGISDFFTAYLSPFTCWLYNAFIVFIQLNLDAWSGLLAPIISLLPDVTIPTVNLSDIQAVKVAAYILPISEVATLVKYLIAFYFTFFLGRIILRWIKVMK